MKQRFDDFSGRSSLTVLALALAACGALDEGGGDEGRRPRPRRVRPSVKVGYLHTIAVDDKLWLGQAEGQWADAGLDIKTTQFDTGIDLSQALSGGSIDVAIMGGVTSNFPAQGQGKIFMLNSRETATARLFVQGDSGISSVADLKGKKVITTEGTTADIYLHRALEKAGLDRKDVTVVNAKMPDAVSAFIGGQVPAVALWVPFDLRVNESGKGAKEIDNAGNYPDAGVGDGWIANNDWYADNQADRQEDHRRLAEGQRVVPQGPRGLAEEGARAGLQGRRQAHRPPAPGGVPEGLHQRRVAARPTRTVTS